MEADVNYDTGFMQYIFRRVHMLCVMCVFCLLLCLLIIHADGYV